MHSERRHLALKVISIAVSTIFLSLIVTPLYGQEGIMRTSRDNTESENQERSKLGLLPGVLNLLLLSEITSPTILSTTPADASTDVGINIVITATFSQDMDETTISASTFTLQDSNHNPVIGVVTYASRTATFTPSTNLAYFTVYTATITEGVKDLAGSNLVGSYTWSFTTGNESDTKPTVTSSSPADGETDIDLDAAITATFSKAMDPSTINTSTFYVRYKTYGAFFTGDVSYEDFTATFKPMQFTYDTLLTATVTTGVKDLAGNAMESNYVWQFRSRLPPEAALDTTFGSDGKVTTDLGGREAISSIVMHSDGKISVAGTSYRGPSLVNDFALARYNPNGTLDDTFGSSGTVVVGFGGDDYVKDLALQSDGKLVVLGSTYVLGGNGNIVLARYNTDGTLDETFGTSGIVTTDFGYYTWASGLGLQSNGKIVVSGTGGETGGLLVARYDTDGSLDPTFGIGGKSIGAAVMSYVRKLALQSDGKIVIVGTACCYDFALVRYNTDGTLDMTFGTDGMVTTDFNGSDYAESVAIQQDGKIIAVGSTALGGGYSSFALARYDTDGDLDATFGADGKVVLGFGGNTAAWAYAIAIQADGKIVAAGGCSNVTETRNDDIALLRIHDDGTLDETFGENGKSLTDIDNSSNSASALVIQSDGKIVAAGHGGAGEDFALVRYAP